MDIYIYRLRRKELVPVLNFCSTWDSTTGLGSSFHDLVVAGMKLLAYWDVLHLRTVKARLFARKAFLVTRAGWKRFGNSLLRGCLGLWTILYSIHSELTERRCHKSTSRSGIKNLQALTFLSSNLRWDGAAEDQAGEQYSKHGKMKELKHFLTTEGSSNSLCDFLSKPIFWATDEETDRTCCSKVIVQSI